ncbi:unnamed protein product [Bemisia tabaci]|uniref:Endoplasmic reticulum transmembrane protein n=1 Tax=Bemisia tabaci TaxID=7038 RepID=A0A9P0EZV1_BEMTA|nr:PREDICTED: B-cell receptor-associated protein 31 [Bemisia tabaci]CAH0385973.1 unnamed protein product [Bemisia tabaci]
MSLQWTVVAVVLYVELTLVTLLILPILSARRWQKIFKSRSLQFLYGWATYLFGFILCVLVIFLLDAIREMRKYSNLEHTEGAHVHMDAEMQFNMKLFRAQRNFYISGFSLFLSFVIRRLIILISQQAALQAETEAALAQAKSATSTANALMNKKDDPKESESKTAELEKKVQSLEKELEKTLKDKNAIKSQAESVSKEYDRLMEEHAKVLKKVGTAAGDKKSD